MVMVSGERHMMGINTQINNKTSTKLTREHIFRRPFFMIPTFVLKNVQKGNERRVTLLL